MKRDSNSLVVVYEKARKSGGLINFLLLKRWEGVLIREGGELI